MSGTLIDVERNAEDRGAAEAVFRKLDQGDLLLRYQQRTIDKLFSGTALLVIEKSRRIGLTWGLASYLVLKAATRTSAGGQTGYYMGYDKEMAREFIEACAMWARAFNIAAEAIDSEIIEDEDGDILAFRIRFASGHKVVALPSVPRALRGKQGIVVIDEAAFHKDVAEVIKAAVALLIWGGQVIIVSTHDGVGNAFNKLLDEIRAGRRKGEAMTITFADAMADGLYERVNLVAQAKGVDLPDKEIWEAEIRATYGDDAGEELDCIPKVGSGSLLSIEDIIACEHDDCGIPELYEGGLSFIGRDVARRNDGQVQYLMEMIGDVLWQRDTYEEIGQTFAHQDAFFNNMFRYRRIVSAWVDQTGMGEKVVEDLKLLHGDRVHGELLTGPSRLDLALSLSTRFQEHRIRIRKDPKTRADLLAIKKVGSEQSGGIRIVNDGTVHADRFWAYALASRAADLPPPIFEFHSAGKRGGHVGRSSQTNTDIGFGTTGSRAGFVR